MNFTHGLELLQQRQKELGEELKSLSAKVTSAALFTEKFLDACREEGLKKIAIGVSHDSIPESVSFPFGPDNSVFSNRKNSKLSGSPAIWEVVRKLGISGGCGNGDQHQLTIEGKARLIDGVYHLKDGSWKKVG
jgi:hypothetical protein